MKVRAYTDTSVLGGCQDDEFREPSRRLLDAFRRGELTLVLSELTVRELEIAPEAVRSVLRRLPDEFIETFSFAQYVIDTSAETGGEERECFALAVLRFEACGSARNVSLLWGRQTVFGVY